MKGTEGKTIIIAKREGKPDQVKVVRGKPNMSGQPAEVKVVERKPIILEQPVMKLVPEKEGEKRRSQFLKTRKSLR